MYNAINRVAYGKEEKEKYNKSYYLKNTLLGTNTRKELVVPTHESGKYDDTVEKTLRSCYIWNLNSERK